MLKKFLGLAAAGAVLFLPALAFADLTVQFNSSSVSIIPGSTATLSGSITNTGAETIYINGFIGVSTGDQSGNVTIDQVATTGYLPPMLVSGQVYQGPLVKVNTTANATLGQYNGTYNLAGGTSTTSLASLGVNNFTVNVSSSVVGSPTAVTASTTGLTMPGGSASGLTMPGGYDGSGDTTLGQGLQIPSDQVADSNSMVIPGAYQNGPRLIKLESDPTVYWVSENNIKIPMRGSKVFLSYHNKWEDVVTVSQEEFDYYQNAKYIWLNGTGGIYKIDGSSKRLIGSPAWSEAGVDVSQIIWVNRTDFNSYSTGSKITDSNDVIN